MDEMSGEVISVEEAFNIMFDEFVRGCDSREAFPSRKNDVLSVDEDSSGDSSIVSHPPLDMTLTKFGAYISKEYYYITKDLAEVFYKSISIDGVSQDDISMSLPAQDDTEVVDDSALQYKNGDVGVNESMNLIPILNENEDDGMRKTSDLGIISQNHNGCVEDPDFVLMGHSITHKKGPPVAGDDLVECIVVMVNWKSREMFTKHFEGAVSNLISLTKRSVFDMLSSCSHVSKYLREEGRKLVPLGILLDDSFIKLFWNKEDEDGTILPPSQIKGVGAVPSMVGYD